MKATLTFIFACLVSANTSAHHSRAEFSDEIEELEGEIVKVQWVNPHPHLTIKITGGSNIDETWRVQTFGGGRMFGGAEGAARLFSIGSNVRFLGSKSTRRPNYFLGTNALLEDGTEAILGAVFEPRWSERFVSGVDGSGQQQRTVVDAASEDRGIFRIWSMSERNAGRERHMPFQENAVRARQDWDPTDNPIERCEQPGMPAAMTQPVGSIQFLDMGTEIELRARWFNTVRTIYLENALDPESQPTSPMGYSVGRWEGNTLVIETKRINWPYFDSQGTSQSEAMHMTERYTLSDDQTRLDQHITFVDPATFTEPATYGKYYMALGDAVMTSECHVF